MAEAQASKKLEPDYDRWAPTNDEDPSNKILKNLDMGSISFKKREMELLEFSYSIKGTSTVQSFC